MRPRAVRLEPGVLELEPGGRALPSGGVQHGVRRDHLAAGELCQDVSVVAPVDRHDRLAEAQRDAQLAQVVLERLDDLRVDEREKAGLTLDHRHAYADRREDRRVLDADHAGADDRHRRGDALELEDAVRVQHGAAVEVDVRRLHRRGADCDHDLVGGHATVAAVGAEVERVLVDEPRRAGQQVDVVARQLVPDHLGLAVDHAAGAPEEVLDRDLVLDPVGVAVHVLLEQPGQIERGRAERLGRQRARVRTDAADAVRPLHDRHPVPELGGLDCGSLSRRAAADGEEFVVVCHVHLTRFGHWRSRL